MTPPIGGGRGGLGILFIIMEGSTMPPIGKGPRDGIFIMGTYPGCIIMAARLGGEGTTGGGTRFSVDIFRPALT